MKCPGNPEHEGIRVTYPNSKSPHYAAALCEECGLWIKHLSKKEARQYKEEASETSEPSRLFSAEERKEIRGIVRREIMTYGVDKAVKSLLSEDGK